MDYIKEITEFRKLYNVDGPYGSNPIVALKELLERVAQEAAQEQIEKDAKRADEIAGEFGYSSMEAEGAICVRNNLMMSLQRKE